MRREQIKIAFLLTEILAIWGRHRLGRGKIFHRTAKMTASTTALIKKIMTSICVKIPDLHNNFISIFLAD